MPRSDYRSHLDVIPHRGAPGTPDQDSGVACAEVLLALRSEEADPLEDVVLNVEKFQIGHIVVSLKTYDAETRASGPSRSYRSWSWGAAPQASLKLPTDEVSTPALDWAFPAAQALARDLGPEHLQLEARPSRKTVVIKRRPWPGIVQPRQSG